MICFLDYPKTCFGIPFVIGFLDQLCGSNVIAATDGSLFLSVGSATDVNAAGNEPPERAAIWKLQSRHSVQLVATGNRHS